MSYFPLTVYDLAVAPFARTNCLNQIMVCIPIAVVKLLQSMCRKQSGLLPFPPRRCGAAVWPGSSGRSAQRNAGIAAKVGDAKATTPETQFSLYHSGIRLLQEVQIGAFGYQNMPPVCSSVRIFPQLT